MYLYISWNTYIKLNESFFFLGETPVVKIVLAYGSYMIVNMILLQILQTPLIKGSLFQITSFLSILIFRFNHNYEYMHLLKRMVQKLDLYCFKYSLFQTINIFWLLLWRLCKFSSCINPVFDPNFFIRGIKKTQSLRFFYQINCDKILNNSNKTRF